MNSENENTSDSSKEKQAVDNNPVENKKEGEADGTFLENLDS